MPSYDTDRKIHMTRDIGDLYFYISMGIGIALLALIIFGRITERFGADSLEQAIQRELSSTIATLSPAGDHDAHH